MMYAPKWNAISLSEEEKGIKYVKIDDAMLRMASAKKRDRQISHLKFISVKTSTKIKM